MHELRFGWSADGWIARHPRHTFQGERQEQRAASQFRGRNRCFASCVSCSHHHHVVRLLFHHASYASNPRCASVSPRKSRTRPAARHESLPTEPLRPSLRRASRHDARTTHHRHRVSTWTDLMTRSSVGFSDCPPRTIGRIPPVELEPDPPIDWNGSIRSMEMNPKKPVSKGKRKKIRVADSQPGFLLSFGHPSSPLPSHGWHVVGRTSAM